MKTRKTPLIYLILAAVLLTSACAAPNPTATPTTAVQPTPETPTTPEGEWVDLEGVQFNLNPAVAELVAGQTVLARPATGEGPYWEVYPQHAVITFDDYAVNGSVQKPRLAVYPAAEFREMSPEANVLIDQLAEVLSTQAVSDAPIPALPLINMGQAFHSNVRFLDFQNGSGVRFLTMYAQAANPINNQELVYVFQGLTSDGEKVVTAYLPVHHPALPPDANTLPEESLNAIYQDYGAYIREVTSMLEGEAAQSFSPSLEALDALIASLQVN